MHNNEKTLKDGLSKGYGMITTHLLEQMRDNCRRLLLEVPKHREFLGWSGNTQTSYMCGIYFDGQLFGIVEQDNWKTPAIRKKLRKDKWGWLRNPYEGTARSVYGNVDTDGDFGKMTSYRFLMSHKTMRNHISIVMTTGTEYSEYLEEIRNLDVLTGTYEAAKDILARGFKPIPDT